MSTRAAWFIALALAAALFPGCGGGGGGGAIIAVEITAPPDEQTVSGSIVIEGRALGGSAEVALDDGPYAPATVDGERWTYRMNADAWQPGWHVVRARVSRGGRATSYAVDLYVAPEPEDAPPQPLPDPVPPPLEGPAGSWTFRFGDGTDFSGNGHVADVVGASLEQGAIDGAMEFDGVDDFVVVKDAAGRPPSQFANLTYGSIAIRFRYDSILNGDTTAELMPLFHYGSGLSSTNDTGFDSVSIYVSHGHLDDPARRQIYFTVLKDSKVGLCFDSNAIVLDPGVWYHVVVTIGPLGHRMYLDGQQIAIHYNGLSTPTTYGFFPTVDSPELMAFGTSMFGISRNWWFLNGRIDEVGIYDRVLSPEEVAALHADGP